MSYPITFRNLPGSLEGEGNFDVFDSAVSTTPRAIFHQGETMFVDINWKQSGLLVDPTYNFAWGPWDIHLYLERIGPDSTTDPVPTVPDENYVAGNPYSYDPARFQIDTTNVKPGTFRLTATICLKKSNAHFPFAGFGEGPMIQIHSK